MTTSKRRRTLKKESSGSEKQMAAELAQIVKENILQANCAKKLNNRKTNSNSSQHQ